MNLLEAPWIPVRDGNGSGPFRLLTYEELLCGVGAWQVSLPRDDLELACIQLLVCMTQVMFLPHDLGALRQRHRERLTPEAFADGVAPCRDWFDLDHPSQPFMQAVDADGEWTSMQKLLPGLPEITSKSESAHAFFNETGEIRILGGPAAAIALFNQASNSPSFGGGFMGGLRGAAPITTLVYSPKGLRSQVWSNTLTLDRIKRFLPDWEPDHRRDRPTWIDPIPKGAVIQAQNIGLTRGLFWQPARVLLERADKAGLCDLLGVEGQCYSGFRKEFRFTFNVRSGPWPHPHGARIVGGDHEWRFVSFTRMAPAWTWLSELVAEKLVDGRPGSVPAPAIAQFLQLTPTHRSEGTHLAIGGYRVNKAAIEERRHELISLGAGWNTDRDSLRKLVDVGLDALSSLKRALREAALGDEDKSVSARLKKQGISWRLKGIGVKHKSGNKRWTLGDFGERLFYAQTESVIYETVANTKTWEEFLSARETFAGALAGICTGIFDDLTEPYGHKPELIPAIALARRGLTIELAKLREEGKQ